MRCKKLFAHHDKKNAFFRRLVPSPKRLLEQECCSTKAGTGNLRQRLEDRQSRFAASVLEIF
jgi:hypothetical protein